MKQTHAEILAMLSEIVRDTERSFLFRKLKLCKKKSKQDLSSKRKLTKESAIQMKDQHSSKQRFLRKTIPRR